MTNKIKVGLTSWEEKNQTGPRDNREEFKRLPFMRLLDGTNVVRCITDAYAYCFIRYNGPNARSKFGDRVYTAWPTYNDEDGNSLCPAYNNREELTGSKGNPKKRYFVGVIDRRDQKIKIFDMSLLVYDQIVVNLNEMSETDPDKRRFSPTEFDINIRYNADASSPSGYYHVMPRPVAPLSEADLDLIKSEGGLDQIKAVLERQSASPKPESVQRRLENLGWVPGQAVESEEKSELKAATDEDLSFDEPVSASAVN